MLYFYYFLIYCFSAVIIIFFIIILHSHPGPNVTGASVGSRQEREPGERAGTLPTRRAKGRARCQLELVPSLPVSPAKPSPPACSDNTHSASPSGLREPLAHGSHVGPGVIGEPRIKYRACCFQLAAFPKRSDGWRSRLVLLQLFRGEGRWQGMRERRASPPWRMMVR